MPVVYEVNVVVRRPQAVKYLEWLMPHVTEMSHMIEGLEGHRVCSGPMVAVDNAPAHVLDRVGSCPSDWVHYCISYTISTQAALDDYLTHRAAAMQASALATFSKDDFVAWRRVLQIIV